MRDLEAGFFSCRGLPLEMLPILMVREEWFRGGSVDWKVKQLSYTHIYTA